MKIQPIDSCTTDEAISHELVVKPAVTKSRFRRFFECQFPNVRRNSSSEKLTTAVVEEPHLSKKGSGEVEPSSLCLTNMVRHFIEESNEKQWVSAKCSRNRCYCFNRSCNDSFDDEFDGYNCFGEHVFASSGEACENLKSLVLCASVTERNLLADAAMIVEKNKICKHKDDVSRKIVTDGLLALGYDASVCKSSWDKSLSFPAGEYEYIDVIVEGERLLIDIDFRSEFEIARSTKAYNTIIQTLPFIFVGKTDRLQRIIGIVTDSSKQSLKKKGMHVPPWRQTAYVCQKWLSSSYTRTSPQAPAPALTLTSPVVPPEKISSHDSGVHVLVKSGNSNPEDEELVISKEWELPEVKPKKISTRGMKILTGLASVMND